MSCKTVFAYLPKKFDLSKNQKASVKPSRKNHLEMLHKEIEHVLKPLCSLALYDFHCVDEHGMFRHICSVLVSYAGDMLSVRKFLG